MRPAMLLLAASLLFGCSPAASPVDDAGAGTSLDGDSLTGAQTSGATLATTADLNLRSAPSTSAEVLEVLAEGTQVALLESEPQNGFYHVQVDDLSGWCSGKYLRLVSAPGPQPGGGPGGGPTAAELLAALGGGCDEVTAGRYALDDGGSAKVPICRVGEALVWKADLDVDCDGKSSSVCNKSTDAAYQSQTAATDSHGGALDAASLPYVVVPLPSWRFDYRSQGLALGSVVAVIYGDRVEYGIIGDLGPSAIIGEASYAMAKSLGMNPSPSKGGVDSGATYVAFTGTSARVKKKEDHAEATAIGQARASALVGR